MGSVCSHQTVFTDEELQEYSKLTYFSKAEVLHASKRFFALDPKRVSQNRNAKLKMRTIVTNLEELSINPFKEQICRIFSTSGDGDLTFEDFLDMMSVFSEGAPKSLKAEWAFCLYDFNRDSLIDRSDLRTLLNSLCGHKASFLGDYQQLKRKDREDIIDQILLEGDIDQDEALSFPEFEILISKCPEFLDSFRIRL